MCTGMFIKQNLYWIELNWIKPKSFCFTLCGSIKNVRWVFGYHFCFVFIFVRVIVSSLHFYFELLPDGDAVTDSLARAYVCVAPMHGKFSKSKYFLVFIPLEEKHQITTDTHNNSQAQSTNAFREWSMGKVRRSEKKKHFQCVRYLQFIWFCLFSQQRMNEVHLFREKPIYSDRFT